MEDESKVILTDENVKDLNDKIEEIAAESEVTKSVSELPSSNGITERNPEDIEDKGEMKMMNVEVDPKTGEHKILGSTITSTSETEDLEKNYNETFEEMIDRVDRGEVSYDQSEDSEFTESDIKEYVEASKNNKESVYKEMFGDEDIPETDLLKLLEIVNRRKNNEEFNVYKEFPESVQKMIDKYVSKNLPSDMMIKQNRAKEFRNMISESLLQEFVSNIEVSRIQKDLHKEIESIFNSSTADIADSIIGYTTERNAKYREYAENMEDPGKKAKVIGILDHIDEAFNLVGLKEFCKKCKIRGIDLESKRWDHFSIYDAFLYKYQNSNYSIYSIYTAEQVLFRILNADNIHTDDTGNSTIDDKVAYPKELIRAFFIAFTSQCANYKTSNVEEHAYMYYVLYNIVLSDLNKGASKEKTEPFINNIKECIENLKARNTSLLSKF